MKKTFKKIFSWWMVFVKFLGKINTFILLTLVYFILIGPIAVFFKIIKKDFLDVKLSSSEGSYWISKQTEKLEENNYEQRF